MQSRSLLHVSLGVIAVASIAFLSSSCVVRTAASVDCGNNETRPSVDCSSEVAYQGYKADGGFGIMSLAQASAKFEETALRRISEETERFITAHTRACRDYNACAIDKPTYAAESKELRTLLTPVASMVEAVKTAPNEEERLGALSTLYHHTVAADKRPEEVALRLGMEADLPPDAGGRHILVRPGTPLPTETRAWFWVEVMPTAYVYILQKNAAGAVSVLFPDAQIGTKNPLEGQTKVRIPNGDIRFRLNEKDIGTEHVYFAASRTPLSTLDAALARVREGQVTSIGGDKLLAGFDAMQAPSAAKKCRGWELDLVGQSDGCTRQRGLELDVSAGFGKGSSVGAVTEPGDSLIVYKFTFEHTTTEGYAAASQRFQAQPAARTRGGMVLERDGGMVLEKNKPGDPIPRGGMVLE